MALKGYLNNLTSQKDKVCLPLKSKVLVLNNSASNDKTDQDIETQMSFVLNYLILPRT